MKAKTINWQTHPDYPDVIRGLIDGREAFTINKEKKRDVYVLSSWALKSEAFNNSTSPKRIGEYPAIVEAQSKAMSLWNEYVYSFIESEVEIPA